MIERNDWIDTLDREIFPFVEYPGFENRYPTIDMVGLAEAQPAWSLRTDEGLLNGYLTLSCFMLGEKASAVYSRFSPEAIAGTEAYWVPIYVK